MKYKLVVSTLCGLIFCSLSSHAFDEEFWINTTATDDYNMIYVANMAVAPCGKVFAASSAGLWQSANAGESWEHVPISDHGTIVGAHILRDGTIMIGGRDSLHFSDDCGESWSSFTHSEHEIPQIDYHRFVEKADGTLYVSMYRWYSGQFVPNGIWQSSDRGASWSLVCDNLDNGSESMCIGLHPNGDVFWGSWNRRGIFVLREDSQTCHNVNIPFGGNLWEPLSMAVNSKGEILVGTDNRAKAILVTKDTGGSWKEYDHWTGNRPQGHILATVVDRLDRFFASANSTIWYTGDAAETWTELPDPNADGGFYALCIDSSGYLYAGNNHGEIYRTCESIYTTTSINNSGVNHTAVEQLDVKLSPNPTRSDFTCTFELETAGLVTAELFDMRGTLVKHILQREFAAGSHSVTSTMDLLGAGVYVLQVRHKNTTHATTLLVAP